jgi:Do/DeqQ family serine protease
LRTQLLGVDESPRRTYDIMTGIASAPRLRHLFALPLLLAPAWPAAPAVAAGALPTEVDGRPLPTLAPMLEHVTPAVVNINSETRVAVRSPFADDPFFRQFFGVPDVPRERIQQSLGSGVVVDARQGYVLTNNHVIEGADDIQVTLADGRTLTGTKLGADPDSDVAVLKIPAQNLTALPLADSTRLRVGDFVVAVGNPFGLGQTVTSGIVSALGRSGLRGVGVQNFIQTDASINPGNSGGALVNLRGELVGINTAIYSPSGGNVGIGFAIPSSLARDVMRQLLAYGEVRRGTLGVQAQDLDAQIAPLLGLSGGQGAVVTRVLPGSPAEQAGLRAGDVITAVNGRPVRGQADLANAEALLPIGTPVELSVVRDGEPTKIAATLKAPVLREIDGAALDARLAGARFGDLPPTLARRGASGVSVLAVAANSRAATNGLQEGDFVTAVNQRNVADVGAFQRAVGARPRQLLLTVVRGRSMFYLLLE